MQHKSRYSRRIMMAAALTTAWGAGVAVPAGASGAAGSIGAPAASGQAYDLVASDGGIFNFGGSGFYGSTGGMSLTRPMVGMAMTPSGQGYWMVASDGGVFNFGDARFYGSTGGRHLNQPIVGMAASSDGGGYWLVAADGGVFSFGDAPYLGGTGGMRLNQPIVGMAASPGGAGYWLVARDGGIFSFGDAGFFGSTGGMRLNQPIVGMAATPSGNGYWLVASDGGVFSFGDAHFYGSTGSIRLNKPIVGMAGTTDGGGYWMAASDGGVFNFGDAPFSGSTGGMRLAWPVVGIAAPGSMAPSTGPSTGGPPPGGGGGSTPPGGGGGSGGGGGGGVTPPPPPPPPPPPTVTAFSATPSVAASGGPAALQWSSSGATSCTLSVSPAVAGLPVSVPCNGPGTSVTLPANPSPGPVTYTFSLNAASGAGQTTATAATSQAGVTAHTAPVSVSTAETPSTAQPLQKGSVLAVTFDQGVAVSPQYSLTLTDGTNEGKVDQTNSKVAMSPDAKTVSFTLTGAPTMTTGSSLSNVNLEVLAASGVRDSAGAWNLLASGEANYTSVCVPVNSRVFGGTNCLTAGTKPASIFDVIARPTYDLPGPAATTVTQKGQTFTCAGAGCDAAPEVITSCTPGLVDWAYDLQTGALLGSDPCGTYGKNTVTGGDWPGNGNELTIGNTGGSGLDYIPTPKLADFEQVGVVQTDPASLWVGPTAVPPQIVAASPDGKGGVTFTYNTPVTCPTPSTSPESSQFTWYTVTGGVFTKHWANNLVCPGPVGGDTITATWAAGDTPPAGPVLFKFEGYGTPLIPVGGTNSPFAGSREASQSFQANLP